MKTNNIFAGASLKANFVSIVYDMLIARKEVSYADVLASYRHVDKKGLLKSKLSIQPEYNSLKKAFSGLVQAINEKCPGSIITNGKTGKGKTFRYIGELNDPLIEEKKAIVQKTLEDYTQFCKETSGLLPMGWFASFFENTQLLLDMTNEKRRGNIHIQSSMEQELHNIEFLPLLNKAIMEKKVLSFMYHPYSDAPSQIVLHPQFLKEYNGRWFLLGWQDGNDKYPVSVYPLDRIETIQEEINIDYITPEPGTYQKYFKHIIGVSHEKDSKGNEPVVIRTMTEYMHGLITSKKLHHSQKTTKPFAKYNDGTYGEITLNVEQNRELIARIRSYGEELLVIEPADLRNKIIDSVEKMLNLYK